MGVDEIQYAKVHQYLTLFYQIVAASLKPDTTKSYEALSAHRFPMKTPPVVVRRHPHRTEDY
jgi:hypothetical protein